MTRERAISAAKASCAGVESQSPDSQIDVAVHIHKCAPPSDPGFLKIPGYVSSLRLNQVENAAPL